VGRAPSPAAVNVEFEVLKNEVVGTDFFENKVKNKINFKGGGRGRPPHIFHNTTLATESELGHLLALPLGR
jgi:hypothetical protein